MRKSKHAAAPPRRGYSVEADRGAAEAATWIFRRGGSRRRRGCDVDIPRRRASQRYFSVALDGLVSKYKIPEGVAGATILAVGTSFPELIIGFVGQFLSTESDPSIVLCGVRRRRTRRRRGFRRRSA